MSVIDGLVEISLRAEREHALAVECLKLEDDRAASRWLEDGLAAIVDRARVRHLGALWAACRAVAEQEREQAGEEWAAL